ncbi:MAG: asparaginase [Actinomycetaceae bacterium]|nr:asparaginase [Arcanobacterium sp.]MDD7687103.1 asparaginase [Actinomycetaceae bacterium]MDY5273232.1 asparaginase [Arcanobacterium sp.]
MRHIHVIYAGGTIGMRTSDEGLVPDTELAEWLNRQLAGTDFAGNVSFMQLSPLIDSANATPAAWQQIVDAVRAVSRSAGGNATTSHTVSASNAVSAGAADEADAADKDAEKGNVESADGSVDVGSGDAFVILHGSDTMAYTAAALSFALPDIAAPIIMTGAQLPLTDAKSDAYSNVMGALQAAAHPGLVGVYIFFGRHLLRGNRATKISAWDFEAFASPGVAPIAQMDGSQLVADSWQIAYSQQVDNYRRARLPFPPRPFVPHDVMVLHVTPGMNAQRLAAALTPLPRAVVIRGYGMGNVPAQEPGFVDVLAEASGSGCVIVASSQTLHPRTDLRAYATGHALLDAGAVSGEDAMIEALYAKLIFLFSQGCSSEQVRTLIGRPLVGELTPAHA